MSGIGAVTSSISIRTSVVSLHQSGAGAKSADETHAVARERKQTAPSPDAAIGGLSSDVMATLLSLVQEISPPPREIFQHIDTNGNGSVSKDEFVASRPEGITDDEAARKFDSIDTERKGVISEAQFTEAIQKDPPPQLAGDQLAGGKQPRGGGGPPPPAEDEEEIFDALDTNEDGKVSIDELMAGLAKKADEGSTNPFNANFMKAVKAYEAYNTPPHPSPIAG